MGVVSALFVRVGRVVWVLDYRGFGMCAGEEFRAGGGEYDVAEGTAGEAVVCGEVGEGEGWGTVGGFAGSGLISFGLGLGGRVCPWEFMLMALRRAWRS